MNRLDKALALLADKTLVNTRVEPEIAHERLQVCEACRFFDPESRRCKICKCYVDTKTNAETNYNPFKFRNEVTHCPKGFWNDVDTANIYREIDGDSPIHTHK